MQLCEQNSKNLIRIQYQRNVGAFLESSKNMRTPTQLDMVAHLRTHFIILSKQLYIQKVFTLLVKGFYHIHIIIINL